MKRCVPIYILLALPLSLTSCSTTPSGKVPSLGGNAPYTSRMPSPSNYQDTSAIEATTMLPPVPE